MYIKINGEQYTCKRRIVKANTIKYLSVTPMPSEISGIIQMYRDDGFLLSEDNTENFTYKFTSGTMLILTNESQTTSTVIEPTVEQLLTAILGTNQNKMAAALSLREITNLVHTETSQSDKLGYNWIETYIGDIVVKKEYVEQENPVGTSAENPIEYIEGMTLINNAYYLVDGSVKVWMNEWVDWE